MNFDLPLLERLDESGYFRPGVDGALKPFAFSEGASSVAPIVVGEEGVHARVAREGFFGKRLTPDRKPGPGEQYRFHFDAGRCVGCECCVVACNEQNNNPAEVNWRRVGEVEAAGPGGARRLYLSMGCNHCLEPACLQGCPTESYVKDPLTGIVRHNASSCIGCQYCVWNCPYGVPQFNPERRVVTKCDMCHARLTAGETPACANACPEGAIEIEIVDQAAWRAEPYEGDAPGLPSVEISLGTTRISLPNGVSQGTPAAAVELVPEPRIGR